MQQQQSDLQVNASEPSPSSATAAPSVEAMEAAVHAYVRALNEGNLDAIVALYADGAEVEDPVGSAPKLEVVLDGQIRAVGNEAAFAFSVSFDVKGQRTTIRPIDLFRFDAEGRIVQMRAFFGAANISSAG